MPTWVTHLVIADRLLNAGLPFQEKGFCVGSVGPDCNIENADWSEYIPSRETTHFMTEKDNKQTIKPEQFFEKYVLSKKEKTPEEAAFLAGYYAHLVTDLRLIQYLRRDDFTKRIYERLQKDPEKSKKIEGLPRSKTTLKQAFGPRYRLGDFLFLERDHLKEHPECRFETVIRKTKDFPEYLDFFPEGAFTRKLKVIDREYDFSWMGETPEVLFFFTKEDFHLFTEEVSNELQTLLTERLAEFPV